MSLVKSMLSWSYYPLMIKNRVINKFSKNFSPRLRILSYHDMSLADEKLLRNQLQWLMRKWDIVTPEDFVAIIDGTIETKHDTLLLTFDDGTTSNLNVAERVLKPLRIKAIYFIVTQYALLKEEDSWRNFAAQRIILNQNPQIIPDNFRNMSIDDIKFLAAEGHTIGYHTATHARLSELTGNDLQREIVEGADLLEEYLGIQVRHFAYPFGNFESISAEASLIARKRFDYVYSGMRGSNAVHGFPWHLLRDSNNPYDSLWYTGACLEGGADFVYKNKNKICHTWVS